MGAADARSGRCDDRIAEMRHQKVEPSWLDPRHQAGGTFTVSNLGMHGISSFMPIINPPKTAILGVGIMERRAVVHDEKLVARARMTVTLCCDHRVVYGADAAEFLQTLRLKLEQSIAFLL